METIDVTTGSGTVRGRWRDGSATAGRRASAAFLGIPFGEPPVGELRFAAPVPKQPWGGVLKALEFGATAQRGDQGITLIPEPSIPGDGTLNVNVFTPSPERAAPGEGLPVLVWIHGGGFVSGSPASPWYDGRAFNRDGVVTVTISYRLGFDGFGWIADAPHNRGVLDWLLALEWVQDNIAAFGGNPGAVTIAGQSAGGGAVLTLLGMERAQHLFHRVWSLSGALADVPLERARNLGDRVARRARVEPTRAGLSALTEERLLEVQRKLTDPGPMTLGSILDDGLSLGPLVDGELVRRPTLESLRMGIGADKPLVLGSADDEFTMVFEELGNVIRLVPERILLERVGLPGPARDAYLAANADVSALGKVRLAGRLFSDRMFRVPLVQTALARGEAPTWAYRFSWRSGRFGYAPHCIDVPFFFDCLDGPTMEALTGPNPPQALADSLHGAAVAFANHGDPGWPRFGTERRARVFDEEIRDLPDAYASVAALL